VGQKENIQKSPERHKANPGCTLEIRKTTLQEPPENKRLILGVSLRTKGAHPYKKHLKRWSFTQQQPYKRVLSQRNPQKGFSSCAKGKKGSHSQKDLPYP
jgi:hypothetical protein